MSGLFRLALKFFLKAQFEQMEYIAIDSLLPQLTASMPWQCLPITYCFILPSDQRQPRGKGPKPEALRVDLGKIWETLDHTEGGPRESRFARLQRIRHLRAGKQGTFWNTRCGTYDCWAPLVRQQEFTGIWLSILALVTRLEPVEHSASLGVAAACDQGGLVDLHLCHSGR
jgi:hypothetical protein